jgi:UDP-N-acetylmuramyl pentapeptide phosphotransferase/UDP-N-acetylglucosamine-1-phosphate transferase
MDLSLEFGKELLLAGFITAVFSFVVIPVIRNVVLKLNMGIAPNQRSSHQNVTPGFGGVSFYLVFTLLLIAYGFTSEGINFHLVISLSIVFFTGFLDDLYELPPKLKIAGIIVASLVLIQQGDIFITSLHGFLGIYEMPYLVAFGFNLLLILFIVNAYNLIDGIDGLSSIIGVSAFGVCLVYGLRINSFELSLLAVIGMFSLLSFLPFNFSEKKKIFMGDTGSLFIGFVLSLFIIHVFSQGMPVLLQDGISVDQTPLIALSIVFIPLFDTIRVMAVRFYQKRGIFSPDRNHIHHILVDRGLTHKTSAIIIGSLNLISCLGVYYFASKFEFAGLLFGFSLWVLIVWVVLFELNKAPQNMRLKIKVRNFLYRIYRIVWGGLKTSIPSQTVFNQKLKAVRNFMF